MSQAGILDVITSNPEILTRIDTDLGSAIPIGNIMEIFGGTGISVSASGNTVLVSTTGAGGGVQNFITDDGAPEVEPDGSGTIQIIGSETISSTGQGPGNVISTAATDNFEATGMHLCNGSTIETADVTVVSDGTKITVSVEREGGGDLTVVFSDGYFQWPTTPAVEIAIVEGTDTVPQKNYVYLDKDTKLLQASTVSFPSTEHARIATVICQSAASLQTDGTISFQEWTDHITDTNDIGHVNDISFWIRNQQATYFDGVDQTFTITSNPATPDNVILSTAEGRVLQLHPQDFPEFAVPIDYYVINDPVTPFSIVNDLNQLLTDASGNSMSGKYFSLVLWGAANSETGESKLFINLPDGSYSSVGLLTIDADGFTNFSIPSDFKGTGFLIAQWNLRHQTQNGGTWTSIEELDLRGQFPPPSPSGSVVFPTAFSDIVFNIFNDADPNKLMSFDVVNVSTGTTREITMVDADIDLANFANLFTCDIGSATPNFLGINIVGAGGTVVEGAGDTITITAGGGSSFTWTEVLGTTQALLVNNGYIVNNVSLVTLTLPAVSVVGDEIKVDGKGTGGWLIAQNAGQTIHFLDTDSTIGTGGNIFSTSRYNCVTLRCITANTAWVVEGNEGVLDVN